MKYNVFVDQFGRMYLGSEPREHNNMIDEDRRRLQENNEDRGLIFVYEGYIELS